MCNSSCFKIIYPSYKFYNNDDFAHLFARAFYDDPSRQKGVLDSLCYGSNKKRQTILLLFFCIQYNTFRLFLQFWYTRPRSRMYFGVFLYKDASPLVLRVFFRFIAIHVFSKYNNLEKISQVNLKARKHFLFREALISNFISRLFLPL